MAMRRHNYSSGTKWEPVIGYSRTVKIGASVYVSGTTATDDSGGLVGIGDARAQAMQTFRNVESALAKAGASLKDVVRTRMYITRREDADAVTGAHGEFFRGIMPCTSLIGVSFFIDERMLVEVEAEAIIGGG